MNVVGLDLSLTATGVARADGTPGLLTTRTRGLERLKTYRMQLIGIVHQADLGSGPRCSGCDQYGTHPDLVVIEDYAFHKGDAHAHALGELGGVIKVALWELGIEMAIVKPSSLKKYACGKGNANKQEMLGAAIRRLGYEGNDHNEADALWLRAMGRDALGEPVVDLPQANREALVKVEWPALEESIERHPAGASA